MIAHTYVITIHKKIGHEFEKEQGVICERIYIWGKEERNNEIILSSQKSKK